jgi:hypothetical protein
MSLMRAGRCLPVLAFGPLLSCLMALGCGGGSSSPGTSAPPAVPVITVQPTGQSVSVGQSATFGVRATGTALVYQWRKNGTAMDGAASANLVTAAAVQGDDGSHFSVTVSNGGGSITSADAALTVTAAVPAAEYFVDPVSGSDQGDGSPANPWRNLQDVIDQKVQTRTWEGPLPYAEGMNQMAVNADAPVRPGDTIWLRSGDYGALTIHSAYNAAPITVAAATGQTPKFSNVLVQSSQNWILRGFTASPSFAATYSNDTIVTVENHDWSGPSYDDVIDGFEIYSVPDESVWTTKADWDTKAASAVLATGDRVTIRNCRIRNVGYGIGITGIASRVEHNTVDGFCGDGLRGLGDDEVLEYNLVKNARDVNDDHRDGFQSWSTGADGNVGTGVVKNITLRGNTIIGYESPSIPFAGTLQGIGCFDGFFDGWVVENNVIITDHWHGISFYGAKNLRIVNNTVLDLNDVEPGPPWIMITDHEDGTKSSDCVVRNNLTTALSVSGTNVVEDHNMILPADLTGYFVDVANHDVHLAAGSPAIGQGSSDQAPALDADGVVRGSTVDVGAYEYVP